MNWSRRRRGAARIWNCIGGVETSSTDANGQRTQVAYDTGANVWRPLQLTAPDGSVTSIGYISANQVERAMTFNAGASTSDTLATLDGLGRPVLSQRLHYALNPFGAKGTAAYDSALAAAAFAAAQFAAACFF